MAILKCTTLPPLQVGPHAAVGGGERGAPPRDRLPAALDRQGRQRRDADGRRRKGAPPEDEPDSNSVTRCGRISLTVLSNPIR